MCDELVASLGVGDNVIFEGALPPATIRSYMKDSFLFVQHSIVASDGDMEGTPVAILEAGAAGLPVVSTRHAGIPEIVSEGETGLLVAERDVSGMARAILRIADDRVLARTLGAAAKRRIENSYTMDKHIETIAAAMGG
jgi:glycosyltransferase involved in cell wall biosynthesis